MKTHSTIQRIQSSPTCLSILEGFPFQTTVCNLCLQVVHMYIFKYMYKAFRCKNENLYLDFAYTRHARAFRFFLLFENIIPLPAIIFPHLNPFQIMNFYPLNSKPLGVPNHEKTHTQKTWLKHPPKLGVFFAFFMFLLTKWHGFHHTLRLSMSAWVMGLLTSRVPFRDATNSRKTHRRDVQKKTQICTFSGIIIQ